MKLNKGFTIVECMVVVVVISIIAAMVIGMYNSANTLHKKRAEELKISKRILLENSIKIKEQNDLNGYEYVLFEYTLNKSLIFYYRGAMVLIPTTMSTNQ